MKKILPLLATLALAGCFGRKPAKIGLEGHPMPEIDLIALDNSYRLNTKTISAGKPTIIFSFEPWCAYCRAQTEEMISNISDFHDANIYMVAASQQSIVKQFSDKYGLAKFKNIKIVLDTAKSFRKYFNDGRIPYVAVYNRNKKLDQVFIGKSNIHTIANAINKN